MKEPKVSVIIPVYNADRYLELCMDSVLNQTLKDIEIICVDDGSTDKSLFILKKFQQIDSRLKIINQDNLYAGTARNNGMKVANGKYLAFLDADDMFELTMLEQAYKQAEKVNADIVVFGGSVFEGDLSKAHYYPALLRTDMLPNNEVIETNEGFEYLFNFTTPAPWNKLFKRSFIQKKGLFFQEHKRINDAYFVVVSLALANRIGIVNKNLLYYRTNNNCSLQGTINESPLLFFNVFLDIKEQLIKLDKYKSNMKSFRQLALSICIYNLELVSQDIAYEELYNQLKYNIFEQLGIKGTDEYDYYNKYAFNQYKQILSDSPLNYLLKKAKKNTIKTNKAYLFPFGEVEKGSWIILYAAGNVGRMFYSQIQKTHYCNVVAWVDKNIMFSQNPTIKFPDEVDLNDCDYIVIAIEDESIAQQVKDTLKIKYKVEHKKIIWKKPFVEEINL